MPKKISAVVLAAGEKSVAGSPKVLAQVDGVALVRRVVDALVAAGLSPVVVAGAHRDAVEAAVASAGASVVANPDHAQGLHTSIRAGLEAADASADAYLFVPADLPLLDGETVTRLVTTFEEGHDAIVVPVYQGVPGYPIIVDRRLRETLLGFGSGEDLDTLLLDHPRDVLDVHLLSDKVVFDVDDADDYVQAHRRLGVPLPGGQEADAPA
jgi:molybdenum cofactor cytidylyltransferase